MRTDQINVILLIALISWGTAQILKTLIHFIKTKNFKAERLTGAGGMPSAHSATVCATAITTCRVCGICSPEFALAMILAMVVMYDAMGVRRSAGLQAKAVSYTHLDVYKRQDQDGIAQAIVDGIKEYVTRSGVSSY